MLRHDELSSLEDSFSRRLDLADIMVCSLPSHPPMIDYFPQAIAYYASLEWSYVIIQLPTHAVYLSITEQVNRGDTTLVIVNCVLAFGTFVASIFGMNLDNTGI